MSEQELLVTGDDVVSYLERVGLLSRLATSRHDADVREVTAGNMNRVFIASGPLGSVAIKQAPPYIQVVGAGWPMDPARIGAEARAYEQLAAIVPEVVPRVDYVDLDSFVLVMEDLSEFAVLRDALVEQVQVRTAGRDPAEIDLIEVGRAVGRFVGSLTYATSEHHLGAEKHIALARTSANHELCALTLDVVLDEPFREHEHNRWHPELSDRIFAMYTDQELQDAVASIRRTFKESAQGLLHGDLHSGSVMIGRDVEDGSRRQTVKVFDPEFSFVGPIGMDLGLFWANLRIAAIAARVTGHEALADARNAAIDSSWLSFTDVWQDHVSAEWFASVRSDSWRFAGVEAMRRVAGYAHVADLENLPEPAAAIAHGDVFELAKRWILTGSD